MLTSEFLPGGQVRVRVTVSTVQKVTQEVRWGFVVNGLFQGEHHQERRQRGSTHTLSPTGPGMSAGPPALSPWEGLPFPSQHTITLPASLAASSGQGTTLQPMGCELSAKHHFRVWPIVIFYGQFCLSLSQAK